MRSGIRLTRASAKLLIALFLFSCVSRTQPWLHHTHKRHSQTTNSQLGLWAYELDTDFKADRVTLESNGFDKTIRVRFGNFQSKEVGFTTSSDDGGNLVAGDIDRDGDVDLIWVESGDRNNAVVLINHGEGNFAEASDNAAYSFELDELFGTGDPPEQRLVQKLRKSSSLTSSPFSDISFVVETRFDAPPVHKISVAKDDRVTDRLTFLTKVSKRGPPSILS